MPAHRSFAEQALHYFVRPHSTIPVTPVGGAAAWRGAAMARDPDGWLVRLSGEELREIGNAAATARSRLGNLRDLTADEFPLPGMADRLTGWRHTLAEGQGFFCLRGFPIHEWGDDFAAWAYWGLGHHLGTPGAQNPENHVLGHVVDDGSATENALVRRYRTSGNIDFHCDAADVVGLLCLRPAKSGGQSRIASSVTVFDEILARRPDLVGRMFEPFAVDRRDEEEPGEAPTFSLPPCAYDGTTLRTFWHSEYFRSAVRHPDVAEFTPAELELLDLYDEIAGADDVHLDMWLQPGDIQFISNHTVVHARTGYNDHAEATRRRHLLRLWLSLTPTGA